MPEALNRMTLITIKVKSVLIVIYYLQWLLKSEKRENFLAAFSRKWRYLFYILNVQKYNMNLN